VELGKQFSIRNKWLVRMRTRLIAKALFCQLLLAFCVSEGWAAPCVKPPISADAIARFKANPQALVAPNSDTRTIEAFVRDLVGTDAALAADFVHLAENTTPRFQTAIAAGLALAAVACSTVDQQAALLIQQAVAGFENGEFQAAFAAVSGDLSTAATEAATASATSSVGSVVIVNPNTGPASATNPGGGGGGPTLILIAGTTATARTTIGTGAPTPTTTTTTAASPVSATR
jgi:hypothetical protein